jgi:predicted DNA-binding protein (MmcQ/YjbR family)
MTIEAVRLFCMALPGVTEDIKWGADLVFSIGGKMFCAVNVDPPHQIAFKCSDAAFAELIERAGLRPAPYMARAMWVQEEALGEALDRRERETLLRSAYEIVKAKLPKSKRAAIESSRRPALPRRTAAPKRRRRR